MKRQLCKTIPPEYDGKSVNAYLRHELNVSGSLIKQMKKRADGIMLNGEAVYVNHTLKCGDKLLVLVGFDDEAYSDIPQNELPLDIVYEDEDLLIINKPAGCPTHPSLYHYEDSIAGAVMAHFSGRFVFRAVNRLDKGTSGLMVIAKHAYAHERLKQQLHTDDFIREYLAVVDGVITGSGVIDKPIARCGDSIIKRMVTDSGENAVTEYTAIKNNGKRTLVRLRLKTGRTHQIRVHLSYIGYPLCGDFLYGNECGEILRPALHSYRLSLVHPVSKKHIELICELPEDIERLM
ncbi:MAG: RluA family pseudouridine synthase [Acutalibacteraceae bacterium]